MLREYMKRSQSIPQEEINRANEEALEVNRLIDELRKQEKEITRQEAAERVIAQREIPDLNKEVFAQGWGERMVRELLALHPDVKEVEKVTRETDLEHKTDAFLVFEKGWVALQITLAGFERQKENNLEDKFKEVLGKAGTTYYGKEDVPLTMVRGNKQRFKEAFSSWNAEGRKRKSPVDYLARKDHLANELIRSMALVFGHRFKLYQGPKDKEWAEYLMAIYQKRKAGLEKRS